METAMDFSSTLRQPTGMRVLVLDDVESQRAAMKDALNCIGVQEVLCAVNCREALGIMEAAENYRFDAVLCSLDMVSKDSECLMRNAGQRIDGYILMSDFAKEIVAAPNDIEREYKVNVLGLVPKQADLHMLEQLLTKHAEVARPPTHDVALPDWSHDELCNALHDGQFVPYFQPKVELRSGRPVGVEVLARWHHPKFGLIEPASFIPTIERFGLADQLFDHLFKQALESAQEWAARHWDIGMAINVTPSTLQDTQLPERLKSSVEQHGLDPSLVTLELTETMAVDQPERVRESVLQLRAYGFKLSVDDFGTGYSGLQQLNSLPFTELKIDRSFVAGMMEREKSIAILESIVGLANRLCLNIVAEGIETRGELEFIQSLGCRLGQAFMFARPMPQERLIGYLDHELESPIPA
jgi:EAL domain-containing protein (putative c-di-GMP-specific phosphodiesterase class I)/CheY-like chemotaxis protein